MRICANRKPTKGTDLLNLSATRYLEGWEEIMPGKVFDKLRPEAGRVRSAEILSEEEYGIAERWGAFFLFLAFFW